MSTVLKVFTTGSTYPGTDSSKSHLKLNNQLTKYSLNNIFFSRPFNKVFRRIKGLSAPDILTWMYKVELECVKRIIVSFPYNITSSSLYNNRQYPLTFSPSTVTQSIFRNMISNTVLEEIIYQRKLSAYKKYIFICYALPYHNL